MSQFQTVIKKGKAKLLPEGLRCSTVRDEAKDQFCNKLIAKKNREGQISGSFKCIRCKQEIEVILVWQTT